MTQPFDLTNYAPGEFETTVLATAFMLSPTTVSMRITSFAVWGKPQTPDHIRMYYCWQAIKMLMASGMPTNLREKKDFIDSLLGDDALEPWKDENIEIVRMIEITMNAFAEKYVAEAEPQEIPRFKPGDWCWHIKEHRPVYILTWTKDYYEILVPVMKNGAFVLDTAAIDVPIELGPPDTDVHVTGHFTIREFDNEPKNIIPLHLEMKRPEPIYRIKPEPEHGMNSSPTHEMNRAY